MAQNPIKLVSLATALAALALEPVRLNRQVLPQRPRPLPSRPIKPFR